MPRAGSGGDRDGDGDGGLDVSVAIGWMPRRWPEALAALSWGNRRQRTVPVCGSTRWTWVRSQAAKRTSSTDRCRYWLGTSKRRPSMTAVPSLLRKVRRSVRVKASRNVAPSGQGRVTEGPARKRASGVVDLAVVFSVVVLLDPGLGCLVEPAQGEIVHTLEHGHQPAFDRCPENLLLAVLIGRVGKCCLMKNA